MPSEMCSTSFWHLDSALGRDPATTWSRSLPSPVIVSRLVGFDEEPALPSGEGGRHRHRGPLGEGGGGTEDPWRGGCVRTLTIYIYT